MLEVLLAMLFFGPFYFAWQAHGRVKEVSQRLARVEAALDRIALDLGPSRGGAARAPEAPPSPGAPPEPKVEIGIEAALTPEKPPISGATAGPPPSEPPAPSAHPLQSPRGPSFEERLGARWAVWAGGAALALGGLLLVRYSIEAGLLGPAFRVTFGAFIAMALTGAGEWMRRGKVSFPVAALPQADIPSVLTAAGTVVAFGTIYAAHALYGFIGPAAAFLMLGATGILAMLVAALHGPWLAGLGLVGAFATPLLVQSNSADPWPVVLYLSLVAGAAYLLARMRRWQWLAIATVAGAALWGFLLSIVANGASASTPLASATFAFIQLSLAAFFLAIEPHAGRRDAESHFDRFAAAALGVLTAVALLIILEPRLDFNSRQMFAALCIAVLTATAWRVASVASSASLAAVLSLGVIIAWPDLALPPDATLTAPYAYGVMRLPDNIASFLTFASLATIVPGLAMAQRLWRGPLLTSLTAALYAAAATAPLLLALIVTYLRVTQFDISIPFAVAGAALAIVFAITAEQFHRADQSYSAPPYNMAAGIFFAAAIAALALAMTMALERGYLTVAFALASLGAAAVAANRDLTPLRWASAALALVVLARVAYEPRIMGNSVGATPIFNWLLIGYGAPAAAFALAARFLEARREDFAMRLCDSLAVIFAGLLAFFEVRHLTNGGDVLHAGAGPVESGLLVFVSLAISLALARMNLARANPVFDAASLIFNVAAIVVAVAGLVIFANPLFTGDALQGGPLVSSLLPAYLLPGVAALVVARQTVGLRPGWYLRAAGMLGVALITLYATLEVRHAFQGPLIGIWRGASDAEHWAYSAAWLILGILFLGYGLLRKSLEARAASAALIVLAAVKITLFDLAGIGGFWRALSFLSLGAVLIGIGLVYQKLIFTSPSNDPGIKVV